MPKFDKMLDVFAQGMQEQKQRQEAKILKAAAKEDKLRQIITNNDYKQQGGMTGSMQVMVSLFCPTKAELKALAAEMIIAHRRCKIANAEMGRKYNGQYWISRAAYYRRQAQQVTA